MKRPPAQEPAGNKLSAKELAARREAMTAIIGMWKDREDMQDPVAYIRALRKDRRSERLTWRTEP